MDLLTPELKKQLPKLYSTEGTKLATRRVYAHFFNPIGMGDWFIMEGEEQEDGDYYFFGLGCLYEGELGLIPLSELQDVDVGLGLSIERDLYWGDNKTYADAVKRAESKGYRVLLRE